MQTSFIARALFKRSHQVPISDKLIKIKSTFTWRRIFLFLIFNCFVYLMCLISIPFIRTTIGTCTLPTPASLLVQTIPRSTTQLPHRPHLRHRRHSQRCLQPSIRHPLPTGPLPFPPSSPTPPTPAWARAGVEVLWEISTSGCPNLCEILEGSDNFWERHECNVNCIIHNIESLFFLIKLLLLVSVKPVFMHLWYLFTWYNKL